MISARINPGARRNEALKAQRRQRSEGNAAWIARAAKALKVECAVVLLGGTDLVHFRMRVAQSHTRTDLLPSFWSHCALYDASQPVRRQLSHVPPVPPLVAAADVPRHNAVMQAPVAAFDDRQRFPNVALIAFPSIDGSPRDGVARLKYSRLAEDLVSPLVQWLGYVWGTEGARNPLLLGQGVPSAMLLEAAYASCGVDLTPGVAERAVCPEAFWQAATWWRSYYEPDADRKGRGRVGPAGRYVLDQKEAATQD